MIEDERFSQVLVKFQNELRRMLQIRLLLRIEGVVYLRERLLAVFHEDLLLLSGDIDEVFIEL
jgi:hypothetical protein